ncbi:MAG: response regulator transcription factor [Chthoniobacteraceae bacterium]
MNEQTKPEKVRAVLVEDHLMFREWLGYMLSKGGAVSVCGEADNIADGIALIRKTKPDIAIVDLTLRGSSGLELVKELKAQGLDVPVLVLSMHDEELYAERVLRAGARGYISKHEASSTLVEAVQKILDGEVYLPAKITAQILKRLSGGGSARPAGLTLLADRELEVFQLIGKGYNSRRIAEQLHLGESTVETYRARIKDKLGIRNAGELYQHAALWISKVK